MLYGTPMTLSPGDVYPALEAVTGSFLLLELCLGEPDPEPGMAIVIPLDENVRRDFFFEMFRLHGEGLATRLTNKCRVQRHDDHMVLHFPGVTLKKDR